mmetsp:Transcript_48953/g.72778  ORF Transcript_48953/g.72778 Transcript_48953/m.72778 type:complete len:565 (-) Transcript_48953:123-1817(-)
MAFRTLFGGKSPPPSSQGEVVNRQEKSNRNQSKESGRTASPPRSLRNVYEQETVAAMQRNTKTKSYQPSDLRRVNSVSNPRSSGANKHLTTEDVNLALEGVDRAEQFEREGMLERAFKLYENSIEILVKALSAPPIQTSSSIISYDSDVLAERTKVALTAAEKLKIKINSQNNISRTAVSEESSTNASKHRGGRPILPRVASYSQNTKSGGNTPSSYQSTKNRPAGAAARARIEGSTNTSRNRANSRLTNTSHAAKGTGDELVNVIKTEMLVDTWTQPSKATKWSDVAGLDRAKQALQEAVILPLLRPDLYTGLRSPPRGILLYGPPGTGKTMLAKAAAYESQCAFFACSASSLTSKWVGEAEKLVRTLFRVAADVAPSIVFLDEIDSVLSARKGNEHEASRRFKTEFMVQVDGVLGGASGDTGGSTGGSVLVLGCSNCPWDLDDAVVRRFQRRIYVPLPDEKARDALVLKMLESNPHNLTKRQIQQLVKNTEGYSCSDLKAIGGEAAFGPLRSLGDIEKIRDVRSKDLRPINIGDFKDALNSTGKSVSSAMLERYESWENEQV